MRQETDNLPSRCQYRNAAGRQCRSTDFGTASHFCPRHAALEQQFSHSPEDLSKLFPLTADKFQSPAEVHAALSELFSLLVEDRVSVRRAAVLAYISSLMLRSLSAMRDEQADETTAEKNRPVKILWNIPRPSHERHGAVYPQPTAAPAETP
jgi:hypothetical protein